MTFINIGYMVGLLIGSMAFGVISDKFGRRKALILGAVMSGCISVAQSFVKNYWLYFVLRLLLGISAKGLFMIAFMICVEISGVDYKTTLGILIQVREHSLYYVSVLAVEAEIHPLIISRNYLIIYFKVCFNSLLRKICRHYNIRFSRFRQLSVNHFKVHIY